MNGLVERESTRAAALGATIWGWEIPTYLFLGGVVAGLMIAVSVTALAVGPARVTAAARRGLALAPALLSLGMLALFIDLSLRLHVFRFYGTLRVTAPMSLGSWVLLLVYPVQLALLLALPPPELEGLAARVPRRLRAWVEAHVAALAWAGVALGLALGVYTGVLLSATVARPLWSSAALAVLFLVSGASTGVAALMVLEREHAMQRALARVDVGLIAAELALIGLWLVGLATQGPLSREAAALVLSGAYAPVFVGVVLFGGLLLPAALEGLALAGRALHSRWVPTLVLVGGLVLRFVIVYAGQDVSFVEG